jgi:hypothetical protein
MEDWKGPSVNVCPHGLTVYLVNGTYIRNHFDSDFSQGGNGFRYRWIPRREIWIDDQINPEDHPFIIFHECEEVELMRSGMSYDRAHNIAKRREDKLRRSEN